MNIYKMQWLIVVLCAFGLVSCSGFGTQKTTVTEETRAEARVQVPCIVVLPVMADVQSDESMTYEKAADLEKGAAYMDQQLADALKGRNHMRLLTQRQLTSLLPDNEFARSSLLSRIGSELKCNAVLETTLSAYVQRVGGEYGADSPASASFSMKLFNTADASVIWSTTFSETQQSLLSNIMSAHKYGLKWLTVEELVTMGITEKVEQCPYF